MNGSGGLSTGAAPLPLAASDAHASWIRIAAWTLLFQLAWYWRKLPELFGEGALPDSDDFTRLMEVRNWMGGPDLAGQGWFDLTQYRMDPPVGADIHWSRLVDMPIAGLIYFFGLFTDTTTAERLTAAVWPTILLVATVLVVAAICRALADRFNPLLAVLFTVMCLTALTEFMPGRIDHHGIQILLFCLTLLGIVRGATSWGHLLAGASMAASISVGLDAILLIVAMLGWLGLEWAMQRDEKGRGLARAAAGLALAAIPLYAINIAPSQWFAARCDANSLIYFAALLSIAAAFGLLALGSTRLRAGTPARTFFVRLGAGAALALVVAAVLYALFPQCAAGPYGALDEELRTRWLVNVHEAKGLRAMLEKVPVLWFSGLAYSLVLLGVGAAVVWRHGRERPAIIAVYAAFALSFAAMFLQYRALRIGVFASIPLCVLFAVMSWDWLRRRFAGQRLVPGIAQTLVIALMLPPVWLLAGEAILPAGTGKVAQGSVSGPDKAGLPAWKKTDYYLFCNEASQYAVLRALPKGYVMSDINSGSPILVFTAHSVVGGPYHRNGRAILDMTDFFETDLDNSRRIAAERGIDYVAWCDPGDLDGSEYADSQALAAVLARGEAPDWLERVSPRDDRLQVFRFRH
ncbi:MAG: hypothetical protein KDJ90_18630 [Nitratireductor sp.]|nr:hypothetical protein [Nitratireductor sp.]